MVEHNATQKRLERLLRFEETNQEIYRLFLQWDDVDAAVNRALALTGALLDVSRVYVFRFRENERILDNTHEWCAPGIKPEIENLKGLPFDDLFPSFFPMIAEQNHIAPHHISELPDDLRGVLEPQDIQTVLWMPITVRERIEGFIGYDETRTARTWLPEEITMARILAEGYARALEREQTTRMLVKARDEAISTAKIRTEFVANMSHEIRTPMTGLRGMLELLLETELDELQEEFANEAYQSSTRLLSLINDMLDFSRLEAGEVVLADEAVDVRALAREVVMTLTPQLADKPLTLALEIDDALPYRVRGDATRIRQVLMNLVDNAVKFTAEGEIVLALGVTHQTDASASLRFEVRDTGIGIAPDVLPHIFESFTQADGSPTRRYGGSGLGLAISQQLVTLMGGTISVESQPGTGSVFRFGLHLPIVQSRGKEEAKLQQADFTGLRVLVYDDERTAGYLLAQQLQAWHVKVTRPEDATSLASARQQNGFDLIFQRQDTANGRAFAVTGHDMPADEAIILSWPLDTATLYRLLARVHPTNATSMVGRVLLADDYDVNGKLVQRALLKDRIRVDLVEDGQAALERIHENDYDLVLMDMQMPGMDGVEALRRIRQLDAPQAKVTVLAMTAAIREDESDAERFTRLGFDGVIAKPFTLEHLREVVRHWLTDANTS